MSARTFCKYCKGDLISKIDIVNSAHVSCFSEVETYMYGIGLPVIFGYEEVNIYVEEYKQGGLTDLPSNINKLQELTHLQTPNGGITSFPTSIGELKNLHVIYAQNNKISSMPASFTNLDLVVLQLSHNQLNNNDFKLICNLENLMRLDLLYNQITEVPEEIGKLKQLMHLYLRGNHITEFPDSFYKMKHINCVDWKYTDLTMNTFHRLERKMPQLWK